MTVASLSPPSLSSPSSSSSLPILSNSSLHFDTNYTPTHTKSTSAATMTDDVLVGAATRKKSKSYLKKISKIIIRPFHSTKKSKTSLPRVDGSPLSPSEQSGAMDAEEFAKAVGIHIRKSFDEPVSDDNHNDTLNQSTVCSKCSGHLSASPSSSLQRGRSISFSRLETSPQREYAMMLYGKLDPTTTSMESSCTKGVRRDSCFSHKSQTSDTLQNTQTSLSQLSTHSTVSRPRRNSILDIDWSRASTPVNSFIPSGASSSPLSSPLRSTVSGWDPTRRLSSEVTLPDSQTPPSDSQSLSGSDCSAKTAITEKRGRFTIIAETPSATAITASRRRSSFSRSEIMALNAHAHALPSHHPTSYVNQRRSSSASLMSHDPHYLHRQASPVYSNFPMAGHPSISIHPSSPQTALFSHLF